MTDPSSHYNQLTYYKKEAMMKLGTENTLVGSILNWYEIEEYGSKSAKTA